MTDRTAAQTLAMNECLRWAGEELGGCDFGDARLSARVVKVLAAFAAQPQSQIPGSCGNWPAAKAAYRFLDNDKVNPEEIAETHRSKALVRARKESVVLAVADTTYLDYTSHQHTEGLGPLKQVNTSGLVFHPTLLVTPDAVPLGVIDLNAWARDIATSIALR